MDHRDIDKTVVLATYFPHKGTGVSNYRLLHWISKLDPKERERFLMFGSLDFQYYFKQGYNELQEMADEGLIRGIKIYTGYQKIDVSSDKFNALMKLAMWHHLPVMFHAGYSYSSMRKYGKPSIEPGYSAESLRKVAGKYPDIPMIFSHMSKPFFHEVLFAAKECPNVYTDMSGVIDSIHDGKEIPICIEEIKLFIRECGDQKILFGTDFPVQTHEHSIYMVVKAVEDELSRQNIFYDNASRLLKQK